MSTRRLDLSPAHRGDRQPVAYGVARGGVRWMTLELGQWGVVNGYVLVGIGHPLWEDPEAHYDLVDPPGGWTYGDATGWLGFDTMHLPDDDWEGLPDMLRSIPSWRDRPKRLWTAHKVAVATEQLAERIGTLNKERAWTPVEATA